MEDHSINIFSRNNIGKKFVYHGDILEDLSNGDVFEVTEYKSDDIHQIGYGASLVSLVNDDTHISLCGSSRLINECFFDLVEEIEEEIEEDQYTQDIKIIERIVETPVYGQQGLDGPQGLPGIPGRDGKDGEDGKDGIDGTDGVDGSQGEQGPQGEMGIPGLIGSQGERGSEGEQGVPGERGEEGTQGEQGLQGILGEPGPQGPEGKQGIQGNKGDSGKQGNQGPAGKQGKVGLKGPKGDKGDKGDQGLQGEQGLEGKPGEQGPKGDDGIAQVSGPLRYDKKNKLLTVSEEWVNSLGSGVQGGAILGGGGGLMGVKQDGKSVPQGNVVRYINFAGSGIEVNSDGSVATVNISHAEVHNALQTINGNNIMSQDLDMNGFNLYNSRIDGGTF